MPKKRGRQTPALYQESGGTVPAASSSSTTSPGMHRLLHERASARGMTVEIHDGADHGVSGADRNASLFEMFAGLTMKEIVMLSLIFVLFLKFTLVPWINVVGSEAWASAKQDEGGGSRGVPPHSCAPRAAMHAVSVVILGAGGVGQELMMKLASSRYLLREQNAAGFLEVFGVFDASGGILSSAIDGGRIDTTTLRNIVRAKRSGVALSSMDNAGGGDGQRASSIGASEHASFYNNTQVGLTALESMFGPAGYLHGRPLIIVDATADSTAAHVASLHSLLAALPASSGLVLANKAPLCSLEVEGVAQLAFHGETLSSRGATVAADATGVATASATDVSFRRVRFEATVGAGLPVIRTLQDLLRAGDTIQRVEGMFSGTASYVLSEIRSGAASNLGTALKSAVAQGLTEPNPCVDLSGIDVARKALIVARLIAKDVQAVTMEDVHLRPLAGCSFDEELGARVAILDKAGGVPSNAKKGGVVQYAATVGAGVPFSINVGSGEFSRSHPFSFGVVDAGTDVPESEVRSPDSQSTPDNVVLIHTLLYHDSPLMIRGPGAGRRLTASAVMSDLVQLAEDLLSNPR